MPRIKITPEQARQVAAQFRQASSQSEDMVTKLGLTIRGMEAEWEGMTKERFFTEFQQWETTMKQFVELLTGIGQQLEVVAERFEAADRPM